MKIPTWLWYALLILAGGIGVYLWVQRDRIATLLENRNRIGPAADALEGGSLALSGIKKLWATL